MRSASACFVGVNTRELELEVCAGAADPVLPAERRADGVVAHAAHAASTKTAQRTFMVLGLSRGPRPFQRGSTGWSHVVVRWSGYSHDATV
jgi:hypothetical protein